MTRPSLSAAPRGTWYDSLPTELHGHKKKLDFFIRALDRLRQQRGVHASSVSVLEVGCSNGRNISLPLAERGYKVTGVDLHEPSIARARADNPFANARFVCKDANEFVSEETFDVVILSDILEHVHEPLRLLTLSRQLLREGGMLLICIPNGFGPAELERVAVEGSGLDRALSAARQGINRIRGRSPVAYNEESGHVQRFRMETISSLIEQAGFKIDERAKGALFGGGLTYPVGMMLPPLASASLRLADRMPFPVVSTWYFRCSERR